jgi:hypothetical protein
MPRRVPDCTREMPALTETSAGPSLLRQCGHARWRHTLEARLTVVIRLAWPGTLADLHVATVREALDVSLTGKRDRGGLGRARRRARPGRRGARWIRWLLRIRGRSAWLRILLLLRVLLLPGCRVAGLLRLLLIRRILARLGGRRLLLIFAAGTDQAQGCHAGRGCSKRNLWHVVRLSSAQTLMLAVGRGQIRSRCPGLRG